MKLCVAWRREGILSGFWGWVRLCRFALAPVMRAWNVGRCPYRLHFRAKKRPSQGSRRSQGIGPTCKSRYVVELIVIRTTRTTRTSKSRDALFGGRLLTYAQKIPHDAKSGAMLARAVGLCRSRLSPLARKFQSSPERDPSQRRRQAPTLRTANRVELADERLRLTPAKRRDRVRARRSAAPAA